MANKHMKICSTSSVTREMPMKTHMGYYSILTRMAPIIKLEITKCGEKPFSFAKSSWVITRFLDETSTVFSKSKGSQRQYR